MDEITKKDGGPAFPAIHSIDGNWVKKPLPEYGGMTLRQWYAGQALVGICTMLSREEVDHLADGVKGGAIQARAALALADALIKAGKDD